ncbi:MAG: hypothetical protein U9N81_11225 [Bacillota bacterium]|nr:hypothetical protein [Bacillota bacterium]
MVYAIDETFPVADIEDSFSEVIFGDVLYDFSCYRSLLLDTVEYQGMYLPVHADNYQEAVDYLSQGFSSPLAEAIATCYFTDSTPPGYFQIRPMDSIPILTPGDRSRTWIYLQTNSDAQVYCTFNDCYEPGDRYLYSLSLKKFNSRWIIHSINLYQL